jgi:addiction module HigA family antidote
MTRKHEFRPDWASAPGDTIADILQDRKLSVAAFAQRIEETPERATDLLQGRASITLAMARRLQRVLGASVEFWMSRDYQYRQDVSRIHEAEHEWISQLPIGDMIKFGWLAREPHPTEEVSTYLRFFGVSSVQAWEERYGDLQRLVALKTSPSFESRPAAVAAWLRKGEIDCESINCRQWDASRFRASLSTVRTLTRKKNPEQFVPELQACCAESGVAVAVVRAPIGCRASGATWFNSDEKAFLLLSVRHLTDDHFWFAFFHEAGHLLLHGKSRRFIEGTDAPLSSEEREANEFAASVLVPAEFQSSLRSLPVDAKRIIKLASQLGVSPGIIVGQMQHLGRLKHRQLNSLKRRFEWGTEG